MAEGSLQDIKDFHDIARLLEQHPEWRADLRRLILTEELLALPEQIAQLIRQVAMLTEAQLRAEIRWQALSEAQSRTDTRLEALIEAQSRTEARLEGLTEAQMRTEARLEALIEAQSRTEARLEGLTEAQMRTEARLEALIEAQSRTEARLEGLTEAQMRTEARLEALIEAQIRTEARLDVLTEVVQRTRDDVGTLKGKGLETHYRLHGSPFFGVLLRRAHVLSMEELGDILDSAIEQGSLSEAEALEVRRADLVVRGTRREDSTLVYLVVEVSWSVDTEDVERAARRAARLAKTGVLALPVAAGETVRPAAAELAQSLQVWQMTDAEVIPPGA